MLLGGLAGREGVDDSVNGLFLTTSVILVPFVECSLAVALHFIYFLGRFANILVNTDYVTISIVDFLLFLEEMLTIEYFNLRIHFL
jgi:hypothetical protein